MGDSIKVKTLDGNKDVKVDNGAQDGDKIKLNRMVKDW